MLTVITMLTIWNGNILSHKNLFVSFCIKSFDSKPFHINILHPNLFISIQIKILSYQNLFTSTSFHIKPV